MSPHPSLTFRMCALSTARTMTITLLHHHPHCRIWLVVVQATMEVLPYGTSLHLPFRHRYPLISLCLLLASLHQPHLPAYSHLRLPHDQQPSLSLIVVKRFWPTAKQIHPHSPQKRNVCKPQPLSGACTQRRRNLICAVAYLKSSSVRHHQFHDFRRQQLPHKCRPGGGKRHSHHSLATSTHVHQPSGRQNPDLAHCSHMTCVKSTVGRSSWHRRRRLPAQRRDDSRSMDLATHPRALLYRRCHRDDQILTRKSTASLVPHAVYSCRHPSRRNNPQNVRASLASHRY